MTLYDQDAAPIDRRGGRYELDILANTAASRTWARFRARMLDATELTGPLSAILRHDY